MALTIPQKKDWAKLLYLKSTLTQKEIAGKVSVTEKTIGKWINNENWKELKATTIITREQERRRVLLQINALNTTIESRESAYPTTREADILSKLSATANNLDMQIPINKIIDVFIEFVDWLKIIDLDKAQLFSGYFDNYIKHLLNNETKG